MKAGLRQLTELSVFDSDDELDTDDEETINTNVAVNGSNDDIYTHALQSDVVATARQLVNACRASGQRREDFRNVIRKGNKDGIFGVEGLREVTLMKDMDICWSATFLMIDRVLELYPAIDIFLQQPKNDAISYHRLSKTQLDVLDDIRQFLSLPHAVQELVSAEKTPTLPIVLPAYERLIYLFGLLSKKLLKLAAAIEASVKKLNKYLGPEQHASMHLQWVSFKGEFSVLIFLLFLVC